jgi:DNA-binding NarL/FixJ family response regulator
LHNFNEMPIRLSIVEDDLEIRKMTASLVNFYEDIECVGTYGDAESFIEDLPRLTPDVVFMDIGLPGQSGIECVRNCKQNQECGSEFVMFTDHSDSREVFEALAAGATGYVLKGGTPNQLVEAIREVASGGSPMSRQISRLVINSFQHTHITCPELEKLSPLEQEVLECLDKGWAYKEIAAHRYVSEHTIRTQVRSIYKKLQVHSRTEALNKLHGR